jgi:hypothetical protein
LPWITAIVAPSSGAGNLRRFGQPLTTRLFVLS